MSTPTPPFQYHISSVFERLEERVLFDGVPDANFILPQANDVAEQPAQIVNAQTTGTTASSSAVPRELIIIDRGVENSDQLLQSLLDSNSTSNFEIFYLQNDQDGIQQISNRLAQLTQSAISRLTLRISMEAQTLVL